MASDSLNTSDGLQLYLQGDAVGRGPVRGTVLLVHGLGEHSGRYGHVTARLVAAGWRVAAYDQRGHGRSEGRRGTVAAPDSLLDDLARVIDRTRARHPGPLVLLGHSLGGLLVARFVAEALVAPAAAWSRPVDALVMSSPALALPMTVAQKLLLAVAGSLAPGLALGNGLDPSWISRDAEVVAAYRADPLVHDRITPRLARMMVDAGHFVGRMAPLWRTPTLLLWAGADRCVVPAGSAAFASAAPPKCVQAREFAPLAHEIFNEPERDEVLAQLVGWLEGITSWPGPGAAPAAA